MIYQRIGHQSQSTGKNKKAFLLKHNPSEQEHPSWSPVKYLGSKSKIAKNIVPILQKCIDENNITTYIEPFVGGANVIDKISCDKKIGSDTNKYLIALLNKLKREPDCFPTEISREHYADVM